MGGLSFGLSFAKTVRRRLNFGRTNRRKFVCVGRLSYSTHASMVVRVGTSAMHEIIFLGKVRGGAGGADELF